MIASTVPSSRRTDNGADYLLITPSSLKAAAGRLADYRRSQGLETRVIDLDDIMDEFSHGLFSPEAIRDFLAYAYDHWKKAPAYVVLVGEELGI